MEIYSGGINHYSLVKSTTGVTKLQSYAKGRLLGEPLYKKMLMQSYISVLN